MESAEAVKDLIVDVEQTEVAIALLEDHRLVEYNKESIGGRSCGVGDVYLGKVKKILPALNAAFVDIGDTKEAFVHYLDLGLYFNAFDQFVRKLNPNTDAKSLYQGIAIGPALAKEGRIEDVLSVGQPIVVQIEKEPISTKGSRLTAEISIAGRNIVLLPFAEKVSISQKIESREEKRRLESLIKAILPHNYGAIIRTAAEGKSAAILDNELKSLIDKWEGSWKGLARNKNVHALFSEYNKTTAIVRDLLNESFSNIYINDKSTCDEIGKYVALISPEQEKIVKLYKGKEPIFDHFDITRQIKSSFGKVVPLKQGAYLVIEHTEALHVIDVNSGIRAKNKEQEENTFDVNCYAAEEIARQMRLRDMGGIVIVDFIDMEEADHRTRLYDYMVELMKNDRSKHTVLPLTKFGLMQITRQRVRPATEISTVEVCPVCGGTGKITASILIDEKIEREISFFVEENGLRHFTLSVNPLLGAYLTRGSLFRPSIVRKWEKKYDCHVAVVEKTTLSLLQYEVGDSEGVKLE
mgnify:FL=1